MRGQKAQNRNQTETVSEVSPPALAYQASLVELQVLDHQLGVNGSDLHKLGQHSHKVRREVFCVEHKHDDMMTVSNVCVCVCVGGGGCACVHVWLGIVSPDKVLCCRNIQLISFVVNMDVRPINTPIATGMSDQSISLYSHTPITIGMSDQSMGFQ